MTRKPHPTGSESQSRRGLSRREFLFLSASGVAASILAACAAPVVPTPSTTEKVASPTPPPTAALWPI